MIDACWDIRESTYMKNCNKDCIRKQIWKQQKWFGNCVNGEPNFEKECQYFLQNPQTENVLELF